MEELPHISRKISEIRARLLGWESRRALEMEKMLDEETKNKLNELGEHKTLVLELMRLQREGKGLWYMDEGLRRQLFEQFKDLDVFRNYRVPTHAPPEEVLAELLAKLGKGDLHDRLLKYVKR